MKKNLTEKQAKEHDEFYNKGWKLISGIIVLEGGGGSGTPGFFARRKLEKAMECFKEALKINPKGW